MFHLPPSQCEHHLRLAQYAPLRVEVVELDLAPPVSQARDGDDAPRRRALSRGRADHERREHVCEEEVSEVVGGHVQLQVVLRHVPLRQRHSGVQYLPGCCENKELQNFNGVGFFHLLEILKIFCQFGIS